MGAFSDKWVVPGAASAPTAAPRNQFDDAALLADLRRMDAAAKAAEAQRARDEWGQVRQLAADREVPVGAMIDMTLEGGIPMAAQFATTELGPWTQAGVGFATSGLGNTLAQGRRLLFGDQERFEPGQAAGAAASGAFPFAGPGANMTRVASRAGLYGAIGGVTAAGTDAAAQIQAGRNIDWSEVGAVGAAGTGAGALVGTPAGRQVVRNTARTAALMGSAGATGQLIQTGIDEGRLATPGELTRAASLPAAFGSAMALTATGGAALGDRIARARAGRAPFTAAGIEPTPGMVLPEEFAAAEAAAGQRVREDVNRIYQQFGGKVKAVAPAPMEGAEIMEQVRPLQGQIRGASRDVAQAERAVLSAESATDKALRTWDEVRTQGINKEVATASQAAADASTAVFAQDVAKIIETARTLAQQRIAAAPGTVSPAEFRTRAVNEVAIPLEGAFKAQSEALYKLIDNNVEFATSGRPGFSPAPILARITEMKPDLAGNLPQQVVAAVKTAQAALVDAAGTPLADVSLQRLRNVRTALYDAGRRAGPGNERRLIQDLASEVTRQMDGQAAAVYGEDGAKALKEANAFYSKNKPLFEEEGLVELLNSTPSDSYADKLVSGMLKSGIKGDEFANITKAIKAVESFSPELGALTKGRLSELTRETLLFKASKQNPATAAEDRIIDTKTLLDQLDALSAVPGTLEALGLGTPAAAAELKLLAQNWPNAGSFTAQEWEQLFTSNLFREGAKDLAVNLDPFMAERSAGAHLRVAAELDRAGAFKEAKESVYGAMDDLRKAGLSRDEARAKLTELQADPVAIAFDNPDLSARDFNNFKRALFDPVASKTHDKKIGELVRALERSPKPENQALLERLRESYIAERIAVPANAPELTRELQRLDVDQMARFFEPFKGDGAGSEIARARVLLRPDQMAELERFGRTARALTDYESFRGSGGASDVWRSPRGTIQASVGRDRTSGIGGGMIRSSLTVVGDLVARGKYNIAAKLLANPDRLARVAGPVDTLSGLINTFGAQRAMLAINIDPALAAELEPEPTNANGAIELPSGSFSDRWKVPAAAPAPAPQAMRQLAPDDAAAPGASTGPKPQSLANQAVSSAKKIKEASGSGLQGALNATTRTPLPSAAAPLRQLAPTS